MPKTLKEIGKMSLDEVFNYVENAESQRDNAIAAADTMESERASLLQSHADALAAKDAERTALETAHATETAALLADIAELGTTEQAQVLRKARLLAEAKAAKAAAEQKIAELEATEEPQT